MATWQATFHVVLSPAGLPRDYHAQLSRVLEPGVHWHEDAERWGVEDGDTIAVWPEPPAEMSVRFDLRHWQPDLYERFAAMVRDMAAGLRVSRRSPPRFDVIEVTAGSPAGRVAFQTA